MKTKKDKSVALSIPAPSTLVGTMPIALDKPLTTDIKNNLAKLLVNAFTSQRTKYQVEIEAQRETLLTSYKESSGYNKLHKQLAELEGRKIQLVKEMEQLGFNNYGSLDMHNMNKYTPEANKVRQKLDALSDAHNPIDQMRDKYLTRLWMSTTMGEAAVIMRDVMGNSQLPDVTPSMLPTHTHTQQQKNQFNFIHPTTGGTHGKH